MKFNNLKYHRQVSVVLALVALGSLFLFQNCAGDFDQSLYDGSAIDQSSNTPTDTATGLTGVLDTVTLDGTISGWACDPHYPNATITIRILAGNDVGSAVLLASFATDKFSEDGITGACGGGSNHRFLYYLSPAQRATYSGKGVFVEMLSAGVPQVKAYLTNGSGSLKIAAGGISTPTNPVVVAPVIVTGPKSYSASYTSAQPVTLSVVASGDGLSYQWYRAPLSSSSNFATLAGRTAAQLIFGSPLPSDNGVYKVSVTNAGGTVSAAATLVIVGPNGQVNTNSVDL